MGIIFKAKKVEYKGMTFDSKGELSCYKRLVEAFGVKKVKREPNRFKIVAEGKYNCDVFRKWGKDITDRKFPHDYEAKYFTPDFEVVHNGMRYIVEFKNAYMQSQDYPLRRTLFLRSWNAKNYRAFFECKSQKNVEQAIEIIKNNGVYGDTKSDSI